MSYKNISYSLIIVLFFALIIGGIPRTVLGIGQVTNPIVVKDVLRGQIFTKILDLANSADSSAIYELSASGKIEKWVSFFKIDDKDLKSPIDRIEIGPKSIIQIIARFEVPKDTPNGTYTGQTIIMERPESNTEEGVYVNVGSVIGRDVTITVTDKEIIKFTSSIFPNSYGIGSSKPLIIRAIYNNQGNTIIEPSLQLKIYRLSDNALVHNAIYPYPEDELPVKPLERKTIEGIIEWQTNGQQNGKYRAEISIMLGLEEISQDKFVFTIGVDMTKLLASLIGIGGNKLGLIILITVLLIVAIVIIFAKKPQLLKMGVDKIKSIF